MNPIDFFFRSAALHPTNIALDTGSIAISYVELSLRVNALAAALEQADPRDHSIVCICADNTINHVVSLLAILAAGKIWVPLSPKNGGPELRRIVDVLKPAIVISDQRYVDLWSAGFAGKVIATDDVSSAPDVDTVDSLVREFSGQAPRPVIDDREAVQAIKFTGGSTGIPKGVCQPRRAWTANILNLITSFGFRPDEVFLVAAPLSHGISTFVLPILAQGGRLVLLEQTGSKHVLNGLVSRDVTATFMPPTLLYMLMAEMDDRDAQEGEKSPSNRFPHLRHLIVGGAPLPIEKVSAIQEAFGPVLESIYGQTEAPTSICTISSQEFLDPRNQSSVGRVALLSKVAIVDGEGRELPREQIGEIAVAGDLLMKQYWNLPDKTAEVLADGWLRTGDLGYMDARGFLFLRGRSRDVIITGGFNVYPVDVEQTLSIHPAVHEAAVFGLPDAKWGEAVHAAIQLKRAAIASEDEIIAFAKQQLGSVKAPKFVHFIDDLPRSPAGKVHKETLKAEISRRAQAAVLGEAPPAAVTQ